MSIKLIFDVEVIGNSFRINETGIFRVAYELFSRLNSHQEIRMLHSNFNFNNHRQTTEKINHFFEEKNLIIPNVNNCDRVKFIPFRKEKLFKFFYKKLGITDYKISYNESINDSQIYHSAYYPLHESLNTYPHLKKIVTIHDLIPILYPQYNENTELLKNTIQSIGKDNYAICVSDNTKKDLLEYAPYLDPDKIFVSKLAASSDLFYQCCDAEKIERIREKYGLPKKYFLSLSTLEPRKNIDHVIKCFIKFVKEYNIQDLSLVLVGSKGWDFDKIFNEYDAAQTLKDKIIITGRIPDEDLATIYSNAEAFFYMSFYEGFGLPPLEAMQCGTATVVSNVSSLPEVVGDAGVLLAPQNQPQLIEEMWKIYSDEDYRNDLGKRALERSKFFSWDKTVAEHINIYKKILHF